MKQTPETIAPPLNSEDLISQYTNLATLSSTEDLSKASKAIADSLKPVTPDEAHQLFIELHQQKMDALVELRRPIFDQTNQLAELHNDVWNRNPTELAREDTSQEGARSFHQQMGPKLYDRQTEIVGALNPDLPTWKRVSAIDQAIGAVTTKLSPAE